jgi:hypothetical protein
LTRLSEFIGIKMHRREVVEMQKPAMGIHLAFNEVSVDTLQWLLD